MNNYNKSANSDNNSDNYSTNSLVINDHNDPSAANGISNTNNAHFNSNSSSNNNNNNNKYDKLVQDYVKLRSKLTILKKAYVELSESSSQKDQSLRKYEQEIEGLNFRNQQLTSRVEILQRELENFKHSSTPVPTNTPIAQLNSANNAQSTSNLHVPHSASLSPSSGSLSSSSTSTSSLPMMATTLGAHQKTFSPALDVLTEELQRKINENALLHSRISELELDWKQKSSRLEQLCAQLENEKLTVEKKLTATEATSKSLIEKLQNDKIKLELNTIQMENQLKLWQKNETLKQSTIQSTAERSSHTRETVNEKIMQSVNENSNLFALFEQHAENFSKVYVYLAERLAQSASEPSRSALKCEQLFSQKLIPLLKNRLSGQTLVEQSEFNRSLVEFFESNSNLIEQFLINDEQSATNNDELETIHKKLRIYLNKINNLLFAKSDANSSTKFSLSLSQLFSYMLFGIKPVNTGQHSTGFNSKFTSELGSFVDILEKILFVYSEKLSVQYTLNFATSMNTADECLVSYLTQFKQSLYQLLTKLKDGNSSSGILELASRVNQSIEKSNENSTVTELNSLEHNPEFESLRANLAAKQLETKQLMNKLDKESTESDRLKFKLDQIQTLYDRLQEKEQQQQEIIQMLNTQNQEYIENSKQMQEKKNAHNRNGQY